MKRSMIIMLALVTLFFGAVFGWKAFVGMQMQKAMQAMPMPAVTVSTATVATASWAPSIDAVGSLRAAQGVNVTAQVEGQITELHFDSGETVVAGQLLVNLYSADAEAQLRALLANRKLAELTYQRLEQLIEQKLVSDFDLDRARADLDRSEAEAAALRLEIEKKSIRAPFAGRVGIRQVDLGQYIEPGDTLVRLETVEQMYVDFPAPQRLIGQLTVGQPLLVSVDAWPGIGFAGTLDAIDPLVDRDTRDLRLRGIVDNAAAKLTPGMFARIKVLLPEQAQVVTVPQSAINYSPYGDSVYVVNEQTDSSGESALSVVNTLVVLGATRGDQVAIQSGVQEGMEIVTAGLQKLRNGARVVVDNTVPVSNNPVPQPGNN